MQSSRLPGKVLLPILGRPMLELMIERLRRVTSVDEIAVATTTDGSCQPIADLAERLGVACYRGSEDDVLDRVLRAARAVGADLIVETTGDCPLIDPVIVDQVIREFQSRAVDYCANVLERTFPRGMDVQVFPTRVLAEVSGLTRDPADREHVSLYIYSHPERYRLWNVASQLAPADRELRLTVDTPEDFRLVSEIFHRLYPANPQFGLAEIVDLLRQNPKLREINAGIRQKPL